MARSIYFLLSCVLCITVTSCAGTPTEDRIQEIDESNSAPAEACAQEKPVVPELPVETASFDPTTIPQDVFDSTKSDVQTLIEEINAIIRDKDFNAWVSYLGHEYRKALSDKNFLKSVSEYNVLKKQKLVLRDLEDYFMYVVVPSRTTDRVEDIEFIGQNRVKAFTINSKGQKVRLYDLEKATSGWKIVN